LRIRSAQPLEFARLGFAIASPSGLRLAKLELLPILREPAIL
jgi:hypothetical protein